MIGDIWRRLQLIFSQGDGVGTTHDRVLMTGLTDEVPPKVRRVEPYALSYRPPKGKSEPYVVYPGGDRAEGICILIGVKRYQLELLEGEVALHDDQGQKVHLTRNGIVIDGGGKPITLTNAPTVRMETAMLEVTGDIKDQCDAGGKTMVQMRATFDGHTHPGDSGGTTGAPNQSMG